MSEHYSVTDVERLHERLKEVQPDLDVDEYTFIETPGFKGFRPTDPEVEAAKLYIAWAHSNGKTLIIRANEDGTLELAGDHIHAIRECSGYDGLLKCMGIT